MECERNATRGVAPNSARAAAVCTAICASSSASGNFRDGGVSYEERAALRAARPTSPSTRSPRTRIDDAANVVEGGGVIARDASNHRIGVAERDHAGAENVAVQIDEALRVALQHAEALLALVEKIGVRRIVLGQPRH